MKNNLFFSVLTFCLLALPTFMTAQQTNLDVEGEAVGLRLVKFKATDISAANDILEIEAPSSPTSTDGQFLECQVGGLFGAIRAQINYDGSAFFDSEVNIGSSILLDDEGLNSSAEILMEDSDNIQTVRIRAQDISGDTGGEILLYGGDPLVNTVEIDGNWAGSGVGRIRTGELQILGGSDIAENFDITNKKADDAPMAGMLVSIDPNAPGKLQVTTEAYDTKVAGVVSGANGVNTGLYMGQEGSEADGEHPIALAGRVYVLADATFGSIQPGDLLTTSPTEGHAMKVKKHKKAQGAVVGKAMSSLRDGQGHVLVLVNLQ